MPDRTSLTTEALLAKCRKAVRYMEKGDPLKDAMDHEDIEDAIRLLVSLSGEPSAEQITGASDMLALFIEQLMNGPPNGRHMSLKDYLAQWRLVQGALDEYNEVRKGGSTKSVVATECRSCDQLMTARDNAEEHADKLADCVARVARLEAICAATYQAAGAFNLPERFLDALALHDEYMQMPPEDIIEKLLPVRSDEPGCFPGEPADELAACKRQLMSTMSRLSYVSHCGEDDDKAMTARIIADARMLLGAREVIPHRSGGGHFSETKGANHD